jgi:hypothetical protein
MNRRTELDSLRGLLLLVMALSHLPTRVSAYANQPLGFVSAAEGFVFLAAFVAGSSYSAAFLAEDAKRLHTRLWTRTLKLYAYHLALLAFAFTIAAAFAALTGRPALRNLLTFYFDSPTVAIISGPLLLYQPPLFDILPMYILFLGLTPFVLQIATKHGWRKPIAVSFALWIVAQLGLRRFAYETLVPATGIYFPLEAAGSFDLFAWQFLWIAGLRIGVGPHGPGLRAASSWRVVLPAFAVAAVFFCWRHQIGSFWSALEPLHAALNKWDLGPLRLVNIAAVGIVIARTVLPLLGWLHVSVLAWLGRASLQVFTAHLLVCVGSLALVVDDDTPLSTPQEVLVLSLALAAMVFVARRAAAKRTRAKPLHRAPT